MSLFRILATGAAILMTGVAPVAAQVTSTNSITVRIAANGNILSGKVLSARTRYVVFEAESAGNLAHPVEVMFRAPAGAVGRIQYGTPGQPSRESIFADGSKTLRLEELDPFEAYGKLLSDLFPGISKEDLRKMLSDQELRRIIASYTDANPLDPYRDGIRGRAVVLKDTCASPFTRYTIRLVIDLAAIKDPIPAGGLRVYGSIKELASKTDSNAVLVKRSDSPDQAIKGKPIVLLQSDNALDAAIYFSGWKNGQLRRVIRTKAKRVFYSPRYGIMARAVIPALRGFRKITITHASPGAVTAYSVCADPRGRRQALNGYQK